METIKILGIDPSLRNTGLSVVIYSAEKTQKSAFTCAHNQVLVNPQKYTGTDAILNMLDMMNDASQNPCYHDLNAIIVESPAVLFNKAWSPGTMSSIAHISGGAVALFGIERAHLFRPNQWNKSRKKEVTHQQTISVLGSVDDWHYEKRVKSAKNLEHILDAASMALWWIKTTYIEADG